MPPKLRSLQYLRAVAALMVVGYHLQLFAERLGYDGPWPAWTSRGVDVFFVISGFVMLVTTRLRPTDPLSFYVRRIIRIVPLYWLLTSFKVAMLLLTPALVHSGRFALAHVVSSYLMLPAANPVTGLIEPVLEPGWTLNYEMYFYALFGALLLLPARWLLPAMSATLLAVIAGNLLDSHGNVLIDFYRYSLILEFAFGMALGEAFLRGWRLPAPIAGALALAGLAALTVDIEANLPHAVLSGVPATALVAGAVWLERAHRMPRLPALRLLGDASYSIYLSHTIVISALSTLAVRLGLSHGSGVTIAAAAGLTLAAVTVSGLLLYRFVEQPMLRAMTHRARAITLPAAAVAPL